MDDAFAAGDRFLLNQARLLERRLFATCFLGQPAAGVVDALRGYQNEDGGFGHALEPDKRCPASLPIDVETAFQALATAGTVDHDMVTRACDFLARAAEETGAGGAVPLAFRSSSPSRVPRTGQSGRTSLASTRRLGWSACSTNCALTIPGDPSARLTAGSSSSRAACRATRTRSRRYLSFSSTFRTGTGPISMRPHSRRTWPASPCSISTPTLPAMACRRSTSRRRPPPGGARCSPTPRSTPTSTGCKKTSRPTAAGPSPGSHPARPPYPNGGESLPWEPCARSRPTD